MPLTKLISAHTREIRAFLDDPKKGILYVRAAPEADALRAKLVAGAEAEPTSDELFFAHSGKFAGAISYYRAFASSILENIAEHRAALAEEGIRFPEVLPIDEKYLEQNIPYELLFADFAERLARALFKDVCRTTVILLHATEESFQEAFLDSVARLASTTGLGRVKYVVFAGATDPVPAEIAAPQRWNVEQLDPTRETAAAPLQAFLAASSRRVYGAHIGAASDDAVKAALDRARLALQEPWGIERFTITAGGRDQLAKSALAALSAYTVKNSPTLALPDPNYEPVDAFADLAERLASKRYETRGGVAIMLSIEGASEAIVKDGLAFATALDRAACSPRVRYVLVDRTRQGIVPPLREAPRTVAQTTILLEAPAIEAGLHEKLGDPKLPLPERINYLSALAAIAATRKDFAGSLALNERALGHCDEAGDPRLSVMVWLGIGNTFYLSQTWDSAERAYSQALALALDAKFDAGTAQATMSLGNVSLCAAKYDQADECYQSATSWYDKLGSPLFACTSLTWLGESKHRHGDTTAAEETWRDTMRRYRALGPDFRAAVTEGAAQVLTRLVRLQEERRDAAAAAHWRQELEALGKKDVIVPEQP